MDSKTSLVILERVKAAKEKRANAGGPDGLGSALAGGAGMALGTAVNGSLAGGLIGAGYGSAKGRPIAGTGRGAVRGGLTSGGAATGAMLGGAAGLMGSGAFSNDPKTQLLSMLIGAGAGGLGGGVAGWKGADKLIGKKMEEKTANDPSTDAFAGALQNMASTQLRSDAMMDARNVGLTALGVGAAGRGLVGLVQMLRANKSKKTRSGPAYLPLPFPASEKGAGFADGDAATTKSGIPWYGPAMLLGGLGGLGIGWKGMDKIIDSQRKKQMEQELEQARTQFHDALISQYNRPVPMHSQLMKAKSASDDTMAEVSRQIDSLYEKFAAAMDAEEANLGEKKAFDLSNTAGQVAGGYGMYAGLTGLLTGAMVYNKISKRSRRAVLDAALKKRQRRRFMQQPTEIYAQPEPMPVAG